MIDLSLIVIVIVSIIAIATSKSEYTLAWFLLLFRFWYDSYDE
jgi:hypothetical protein